MSFIISRYNIRSVKIKAPLKLLFLADLHNEEHGRDNCDLLAACRDENPDLILIGGDFLVGMPDRDQTTGLMTASALAEIAPVYAVNGNHEAQLRQFPEIYSKWIETCRESGIRLLKNKSAKLNLCGTKISVTGYDIPLHLYTKFRRPVLTGSMIKESIGECAPKEYFQILLAHNPAFTPLYAAWGADLTVSGHYHGGVMRLWGRQCLLSPYGSFLPKYGYGEHIFGERHVIITSGLGEHTIPFRIHNPKEMVSICLQPV